MNPIPKLHRGVVLGVTFAMAAILLVVTLLQPAQFAYNNQTDYEAQKAQAEKDQKAYDALLASVQPDPEASKQFLQKVATEDVVREQILDTLNTKQKVAIPVVADKDIQISAKSDTAAVENYFTAYGSMLANYNQAITPLTADLYSPDTVSASQDEAVNVTKTFADNLAKMSVPKAAVDLHKANLIAVREYGKLLANAPRTATAPDSAMWADVYQHYAVIDNRVAAINTETTKLVTQYKIAEVPLHFDVAQTNNPFGLHEAKAIIGGTIIISDLPRLFYETLKVTLAKAFARFAIDMLDKLVAKIEKNFAIASQLYYSNELGRYYSQEYLKKFVADPLDQDIIRQFLPEYFCIPKNKDQLKQIFTAKARQNAGTDIVLNPNDPDFFAKLGKLGGDEQNYPDWWEIYFQGLANQTKTEADSAATKEVVSPGIKSGRDIISGQINKTMASIFHVQEAAVNGTINLGTNNAENIISQLIGAVLQSLLNKFIFTPLGAGQGGGIGILAESNVCIRTPQIKPIVPITDTHIDPYSGPVQHEDGQPAANPQP